MSFRILFNTCSRAFHQSFVLDVRVNMTRKSCVLRHRCVESKTTARFCSNSNFQPQLDQESPSECQSESQPESQSVSESDHVEETQTQSMKFLIVGLGNPDMQRSRHSVGMLFVDQLTKQLGISWTKEVFKKTGGFTAKAKLDNVEISFLKPRVPMNLNGTSVNKSVHHFDVKPENTYLIHDELDKPVGKFQLKEGGSANGHNGVKSVMNSLKSDVMPCVKIGIDRPSNPDNIPEYVLDNFSLEELRAIRGVLGESAQSLMDHISDKCGVKLNIRMGKFVDQINDHDSEDELRKRFGKGNKNRNYPRNDRDRWSQGPRPYFDRFDNSRDDQFDRRRSHSRQDYEDNRRGRRDNFDEDDRRGRRDNLYEDDRRSKRDDFSEDNRRSRRDNLYNEE